ncbi:unnamed protein product, partial [Polarella glacialis]
AWQAARTPHVGFGPKPSFRSFRSSRSNRQASFGNSQLPACPELDALLSLGPIPTEAEVSSVLQ